MIAASHIQGRKVAQIKETLLEIKTSRPNAGDVVEAQIWYNSAAGQKRIEFKDNSVIVTVPRLDYDETISGNWTINTGAVEPPLILHANNQGTSTSVRVTGFHADILDGYHADTAATASTIAARDANGRIKATDPSANDDVVPYGFLQGYVAGIRDPKDACVVATTANLAATRTGNTLTASANGSINTAGIDGITDLALNNRVLVKNQTAGADNGLFIISDLGSATTPWILQRSSDADTSAEVTNGLQLWVTRGNDNGGTGWLLNTQDPITLNTTALAFIQTNGTADIQQGKGIVIVGNTIHAIQSTDYTANALIYASSTAALGMSANLTWDGVVLSNKTSSGGVVEMLSLQNTTASVAGRGMSLKFRSSDTVIADLSIQTETASTNGSYQLFAYKTGGNFTGIKAIGQSDTIELYSASALRWTVTSAGILQSNGAQTIQTSTGNLTVQPAGNTVFASTSGSVGVGLSPTYKLDVTHSTNQTFRVATTGTDRVEVYMSKNSGVARDWALSVAGSANGYGVADQTFYIVDVTGGAVRMSINTSGLVAIPGDIELTGGGTISTTANGNILLSTNGTGNVGIGATFKSFHTSYQGRILQLGATAALWGTAGADAFLGANYYINTAGTDSAFTTGGSANLYMTGGTITLRVAAGVAADAAVTWTNGLVVNNNGTVSLASTIAASGYTQKSVLFAGASGAISQDNANFQVDPTTASTFRFAVGSAVSDFAKTIFGGTFPSAAFTAGTTSVVSITGSNSPAASSSARVFHVSGTLVEGAAGAHDVFAGTWFDAPTITAGTSTLNDAATVYIAGAPTATTVNGTWALKIVSGNVALGTGNVGIGTTTPQNLLSVNGNIGLRSGDLLGFVGSGNSAVTTSNYALYGDATNTLINVVTGGVIGFRVNNVEIGRWSTGGRFAIGTQSPSFDLSFGGNSARTIASERHTTADTAGSSLTIEPGGCATTGTVGNTAGGTLFVKGGQNKGSGGSTIEFYTCAPGGTATTDGVSTLRGSINNAGLWNIVANLSVGTTINAGTGYQIGGAAAAGKILRGNGTNFVASTATIPDTAAANDLLYASASNTWSALTTVASRVLVTNGSGVPGWAIDLPVGITIGGKDAALIIDGTVTGDGVATVLTYTHSLGRKARIVGVRKQSDNQLVLVDWKPTATFTTTKVDLTFAEAPANLEVFEVSVAA